MISIWLGHEPIETTQIYLEANIAIKHEILARTDPVKSTSLRYQCGDRSIFCQACEEAPSLCRIDEGSFRATVTLDAAWLGPYR